MKQICIQLEQNKQIRILNKEAVFLVEGEDLEIKIANFDQFKTVELLVNGVPIPLEHSVIVLQSIHIEEVIQIKLQADGHLYVLEDLDVKTLKLIGGSLTDKYPETIAKLVSDVRNVFHILKDYDTIKSDIGRLKKMVAYLYEEVEEKDVIR